MHPRKPPNRPHLGVLVVRTQTWWWFLAGVQMRYWDSVPKTVQLIAEILGTHCGCPKCAAKCGLVLEPTIENLYWLRWLPTPNVQITSHICQPSQPPFQHDEWHWVNVSRPLLGSSWSQNTLTMWPSGHVNYTCQNWYTRVVQISPSHPSTSWLSLILLCTVTTSDNNAAIFCLVCQWPCNDRQH